MRRLLYLGIFGFIVAVSQSNVVQARETGCQYDANKRILNRSKAGYTAEWTILDSPTLHAPLVTADKNYAKTRAWMAQHTKLGWRDFIKLHSNVVVDAMATLTGDDYYQFLNDEISSNLVLEGKLGSVQPIACLEGIPYMEYLKVEDLRKYPQEFWAEVFKKGNQVKIVGAFYLNQETLPDGVGATQASEHEKKILMASGWTYFANIHDHTFVFGMGEDQGGELVPSGPDFESYPQLNAQMAIITNGIDSNYMPEVEVNRALRAMHPIGKSK